MTLEPSFGAGGVELLVRGLDRAHVLLRARKVRTFQNQTSSDIVSKIVQAAGFSADCDPSGEPHEFIQQDNVSDWNFIWQLADRVGFEFVVEDQTAHFRRPSPEGAIELAWPTVLHSFNPRVTAVQQVQEVTLLAQDPKTKQAIDVTVSTPNQVAQIGVDRQTVASAFDGATAHIASEPVKSQPEGQAVAQALLDRLANAYVAAEGVCDGDPRIKSRRQGERERRGREVQRYLSSLERDPRAARRQHLRDQVRELTQSHSARRRWRRPGEWSERIRHAVGAWGWLPTTPTRRTWVGFGFVTRLSALMPRARGRGSPRSAPVKSAAR